MKKKIGKEKNNNNKLIKNETRERKRELQGSDGQ